MTQNIKPECPFCDIELQFSEEHGFYKCPDCGGEWWPGPPYYDITSLWRDEQRYKRSISKPGGGNRQAGQRKEKRKSLSTDRYKLE